MKCSACGHARDFHTHYRSDTECSICSCPKFALPVWAAVLDWVRRTVRTR
jgi:hypothetical protein